MGQRRSVLSARYSCQFSSPSGLSHHVSVMKLLYANLEKSRLVHMQVSTNGPTLTPSCQSHTLHNFGGERFDPEQTYTSTTQSSYIKHMKRN